MARSVIRGGDFTIRRDYEKLGAAQRRRYERAGITRRAYESGASLQRARGHRRHEHVTRAQRNPQALTSAEYRFAANQKRRAKQTTEQFAGSFTIFKRMSHSQRRSLMNKVSGLNREYRRQHGKSGVAFGTGGAEALSREVRSIIGASEYEIDEDDLEYNDGDYPDDEDFDSDLGALLFYH